MKRFTWNEMRENWRKHADLAGDPDYARDPDALGNVCIVGAPFWLNAYHAALQRRVFDRLLRRVPKGNAALDVGCGAARWTRRLIAAGYRVKGIDLQPRLIEDNRRRVPEAEFECVPLQDLRDTNRYDLIVSVTVLQHIPFEEQEKAAAKLKALTRPGGHVLILENVCHQEPNVFSRPAAGWDALFRSAGFRRIALLGYDHSALLRLLETGERAASRLTRRREEGNGASDGGARERPLTTPFRRRAAWAVKRAAAPVDRLLDPVWTAVRALPLARHAGFLFQAPDAG